MQPAPRCKLTRPRRNQVCEDRQASRHPTPRSRSLPRRSYEWGLGCLNASEALDLIDRAENAQNDPACVRLYTAITGDPGPIPSLWLGSLSDRLDLIGARDDVLREMGETFAEAGVVDDAIDYVREAWERTVYLTQDGVPSDVADAWRHQIRSRRHREVKGFKKPSLSSYTIPPAERSTDRDDRQTTRTLREWQREDGVTIYRTSVRRDRGQNVTMADEREWQGDFDDRMRRAKQRDSEQRRLRRFHWVSAQAREVQAASHPDIEIPIIEIAPPVKARERSAEYQMA